MSSRVFSSLLHGYITAVSDVALQGEQQARTGELRAKHLIVTQRAVTFIVAYFVQSNTIGRKTLVPTRAFILCTVLKMGSVRAVFVKPWPAICVKIIQALSQQVIYFRVGFIHMLTEAYVVLRHIA